MVGRLVMLAPLPDARVASLYVLHTVGGWTVDVCALMCVHVKGEYRKRERKVHRQKNEGKTRTW